MYFSIFDLNEQNSPIPLLSLYTAGQHILHRFSTFNSPLYLLSILKSYLSERYLTFSYKNLTFSRPLTRTYPQGLVLRPILWNILFDHLLHLPLPSNALLFRFHDDTLLIISHDSYNSHTSLLLIIAFI